MFLREKDILVHQSGYDVRDPWSRVVVWAVDERLKQVALLPHTVLYLGKRFVPGKDGAFSIQWKRPDDVMAKYMIEEHQK